ncbi:leucine-rich repeat-containing protein 34-like isoform X2 [Pomacea canaliculata]|uniref:leucine-rich repeat-containing protein 34-like isoform X2 n=1 Tax=Pomacea canaliculata TaxID=400727 RepID=UPI000D72F62B|nr:leucine-rich repeat-containing protein 34-like isoform X2 [Pomacea canaliculata]
MSDIHSTLFSFESACQELGVKQHPYILKMLKREEKECLMEFKTSMHLYLAGNNHLLTDVRINDDDCILLQKVLLKNLFITSLDLRFNLICDKGAKILAAMLENNTTLQRLNLMCNEIGPDGAEALARSLHINEMLKVLLLNGNKIDNKGGMSFAQALQINTTLEHLDVGEADLRMESTVALATVLRNNTSIRVIDVSRPLLTTVQEEPVVHFANMLKVNKTLEELHLQKYDMRDFGMHRLAENLMENFTLTYLDLSCNRITRDGVKELAKVLKLNTALCILDLGFNRLEDDGAMHIAEALASLNTNLRCLSVVSNNIGSMGLCAIADAMKTNTTLTNVFIWGNKLEEPVCIAFDSLIKTGRLDLRNTDVKPYIVDGITYLCELSHGIRRNFYYGPTYGEDVPDWQVRGLNPRSVKLDDDMTSLFD